MSSKLLFILFIILISSCGLKTRPKAPQNKSLPSIPISYKTTVEVEEAKEETKKTEEQKKE